MCFGYRAVNQRLARGSRWDIELLAPCPAFTVGNIRSGTSDPRCFIFLLSQKKGRRDGLDPHKLNSSEN